MPEEGCLLYCCLNKVDFARQMPPFDEWRLCPAGLEGPRENPVFVAPLPVASAELAPEVGAGGRALSSAGDAAAAGPAPLEAPEGSSHGPLESHPEEAAGGRSSQTLPRLKPQRPRRAAARRRPRSPRSPAPLRSPPQEPLQRRPALVTVPGASAGFD
nr:predicted GPI-anchored protein 58 [Aegilops tauschii subsp. strangulata]